jgi:DNA-binding IclR family transcriptional regulator
MMTRETTLELIEAAEELPSFWESIARACLAYLSEDAVRDICREYEWLHHEDEDEDE